MTSSRNAEMRVAEPSPATARVKKHGARPYRPVSWLLAREAVKERVATLVHFDARPEMRKFLGARHSFFGRCYPVQSEPKATRPALAQSCAAYTTEEIW